MSGPDDHALADSLVRAWLMDPALPPIDEESPGREPWFGLRNGSAVDEATRHWTDQEVEATLADARRLAIARLATELLTQFGSPTDELATAALLESRGLRDVDARTRYGRDDIFDLGRAVHAACSAAADGLPERLPGPNAPAPEVDDRERHWRRGAARFARFYSRGLFFALPLAVQVACLMAFGYGSWASVHFTTREATTVALGTICSFVAVGGTTQVIARLGNFYIEQHSFVLARRVMMRISLYGFALAAGVGSVLSVVAKAAGVLPGPDLAVALGYYLLLSLLFLSLASLHTLQQRLAIMLTMLVNLAMVVWLITVSGVQTTTAHWLGLLAWAALAFTWAQVVLRRRASSGGTGPTTVTWSPRLRILLFTTWRYFLYGTVFFSLLFADRMLAWTAATGAAGPIVFRSAYEVGLDWALLSLVLTIAMLEYTINDLAALVSPVQRRTAACDRDELNRTFRRLYLRHLVMLVIVAAVSVNLTYFVATKLAVAFPELAIHAIVTDPVAARVFEVSAVAYSLLAVCLLNTTLFFSVSRPSMAVWPFVVALVVDVVVGTALSRFGTWWWAVGGLLAGVTVLAVISTMLSVRVFRRLDYYYYSA